MVKYAHIRREASYHSGMKALLQSHFDLLLLDMTLPNFDDSGYDSGGRPLPMAGRDILFTMNRKKIKCRTVVITQYESFDEMSLEDLDKGLKEKFSDIYAGYVQYNATQDGWKTMLKSLICE